MAGSSGSGHRGVVAGDAFFADDLVQTREAAAAAVMVLGTDRERSVFVVFQVFVRSSIDAWLQVRAGRRRFAEGKLKAANITKIDDQQR